jgi:hypothetical protein
VTVTNSDTPSPAPTCRATSWFDTERTVKIILLDVAGGDRHDFFDVPLVKAALKE